MSTLVDELAKELKIASEQVAGALELLNAGYPPIFVARYRKERTGGLGEGKLWAILDRQRAYDELNARRRVILNSLQAGGQLTDELKAALEAAPDRARIEDLYLPFAPRPKKSPAALAREKGLEPLAEILLKQEAQAENADALAAPFLSAEKDVKETSQALAGARAILAERFAFDPGLRAATRELLHAEGRLMASAREGADLARSRYASFGSYAEPVGRARAARVLTVLRGEAERKLKVGLAYPKEKLEALLRERLAIKPETLFAPELEQVLKTALEKLLLPSLEGELRRELRQRAEAEDAEQSARSLRALLLQAPLGPRRVLAVAPARGGAFHAVVVDADGSLLAHEKLRLRKEAPPPQRAAKAKPAPPKAEAPAASAEVSAEAAETQVAAAEPAVESPADAAPAPAVPAEAAPAADEAEAHEEGEIEADDTKAESADLRAQAKAALLKLLKEHEIEVLAIGSGSSGRALDNLVRAVLDSEDLGRRVCRIPVNEAGAAGYATSRAGKHELPNLELAARAAVSLARRLQDPLAELVKLGARDLAAGAHHGDGGTESLRRRLEETIGACVNRVGVDLNAAGAELLAQVAGFDILKAKSAVEYRAKNGVFKNLDALKQVEGLDAKSFEVAAGFLRVKDGENPLDRTAIHPERYALVERMAQAAGTDLPGLVGNGEQVSKLRFEEYRSDEVAEGTLKDIFWELRNPGRDARGRFALPEGNEGVRGLADVQPGQVLRGVVTNLASFGAFVDLGIPQEGLVHISELSHRYVQDPSVLLNVGQAVRVKVLGVDAAKKRISLSIKALEDPAAARGRGGRPARAQGPREPRGPRPPRAPRAPRAGAAPAEGAAAGAAAGGGERPPGRGRGERAGPGAKDRPGRDGRPRRKREDDGPRVKPEFAKFFDKGSKAKGRRDNKKRDGPRRADEANRDEVREILRKQESGGSTLGDLLKKAGLGDDAGE